MRRFVIILFVCCWAVVRGQVADFATTDFSKADSIAKRYAAHSLIDLKTLADKLTDSLGTEQEKFRAIYQWVCSNIEADYELFMLNRRNRAKLEGDKLARWNKKFNVMVFENLKRHHKTICTGYAYLIRELAFHAGLHCEIVNGYAKPSGVELTAVGEVNHSWNRVELNGKWYVCDATWSSGVFSLATGEFVKRYDGKYFLMEPEVFGVSHCEVRAEK